jgi:hypothetical protein
VVEVKSRRDLVTESDIAQIAEYTRRLKGWRLEVQVIEEAREALEAPTAPLSLKEALRRLHSASLLLKRKDAESALVVAWSAFEAVLRQLSWDADVVISPWSGVRAAKQLVALGVLTRSDYELFMRGLDARNHAVHGGTVPSSVRQLVQSVISAVRRLAEQHNKKRSA